MLGRQRQPQKIQRKTQMAKTLDQLMKEREALDSRIRALKKTEREGRTKAAMKALETLGLLDLPEAELVQRLQAAAGKRLPTHPEGHP